MSPAAALHELVATHTAEIKSLHEGQVRVDNATIRLEGKVDAILIGVAGALIIGLASLVAILLTRH